MNAKEIARGGLLAAAAVALLYVGGAAPYIGPAACIVAGVASAVPLGADDADEQPARADLAGIVKNVAHIGVQAALHQPVAQPFDQLFQQHTVHLVGRMQTAGGDPPAPAGPGGLSAW